MATAESLYQVTVKRNGQTYIVPSDVMLDILSIDGTPVPWFNCDTCTARRLPVEKVLLPSGRKITFDEKELVPCTHDSKCKYLVDGDEWKVCEAHDAILTLAIDEGRLDGYGVARSQTEPSTN